MRDQFYGKTCGQRVRAMNPISFILIEPCNFEDHPVGGQLTFARQLLDAYGCRIATVGYTLNPDEPVGVWFNKASGVSVRLHFNLAFILNGGKHYKIPRRLLFFYLIKKHRKALQELPCRRLFIQEHSVLMAIHRLDWESICYCFPGASSPLKISRFQWAKPLSWLFDQLFFRSMNKADVLLAAADERAIDDLKMRAGRFLKGRSVEFFPTRVDTSVFFLRQGLPINGRPIQIVSTGRLHWAKGWELILESLALIKDKLDFQYIYVGDGPDRDAFLASAKKLGVFDRISLAGFLPAAGVAEHLRKADLYLMGSLVEGWPTTLVEAYVSGVPMVSTDVSGASTIISNGINGFVCDVRDPRIYAHYILKALYLPLDRVFESVNSKNYATDRLLIDLEMLWR